SPAQALDELPGLWGQVEPVVARHVRSVDGLGHAGDAVPIELEARADDEVVVVDLGLGGEGEPAFVRVDLCDCVLDPGHALGHHLGLRTHALAAIAAPPPTSVHSGW